MTGTAPAGISRVTGSRMESLIVMLDRGAVAFCNYANPLEGAAKPDFMPLPVLKAARRFAHERALAPVYLLGRHEVPPRHADEIGKGAHVILTPFSPRRRAGNWIPVLEATDAAALARSRGPRIGNAILRIGLEDMPRLAAIFGRLAGRVERLNVCLFDVGRYRDADFDAYREQLDALAEIVARLDWPAGGTECNLVTDRVLLRAMNNCDAGVRHLTVAPNGLFYLCPGFYHRDEAGSVGSLRDAPDIRNVHLLTIAYAPICRRCDAFQCRRCVLLNKQLTEEVNTPSRQQCVTAHLEREASRRLLETLRSAGRLDEPAAAGEIPRLDYLDPFDVAKPESGHDVPSPPAGAPPRTCRWRRRLRSSGPR